MLGDFFKKTTPQDILKSLNSKTFNEDKINNLLTNTDINLKFADGESFLHKVIPHNNIESIKALIKYKIDVNAKNADGDSPLHIASRYTYTDTLNSLLNAGADANSLNDNGRLPIQEAIAHARYEMYNILKNKTSNFNHVDNHGITLLKDSISSKSFGILKDLLENRGVTPDNSILYNKALYSDFEILKTILRYFKDINIADGSGNNLLFYMVKNGMESLKEFEYLVEKGIDIDCINNKGENFLLFYVKYIIEKSNDKDYKEEVTTVVDNDDENNKKVNSKLQNLMDLVPVIIESGIDTTVSDEDGDNILTTCVKSNNVEMLSLLLDYGVDPNILTVKGKTALEYAALQGNDSLDILFLLLDYGASANIKDKENKTIVERLIDIELFKKNDKKLPSFERRQVNDKFDYVLILDAILANSEVKLSQYNSKEEPYIFEPMSFGNMHLIKLLLKYGADVNQADHEGLNIIYKYMAENKTFRREIDQKNYYTNLKSIIGLGANVNAKDSFGGITLHKAILDCDIHTVKIILHSGADINAVDNRGRNMIHNCMWKNKIKEFRLIYTFNKKLLNEPDKFGVLPINYAAFLGYKDLVLELIRTGSHINNPYKKTPYIINFLKRFHPVIATLEEEALTKAEKNTLKALLDNMKSEFQIDTI